MRRSPPGFCTNCFVSCFAADAKKDVDAKRRNADETFRRRFFLLIIHLTRARRPFCRDFSRRRDLFLPHAREANPPNGKFPPYGVKRRLTGEMWKTHSLTSYFFADASLKKFQKKQSTDSLLLLSHTPKETSKNSCRTSRSFFHFPDFD